MHPGTLASTECMEIGFVCLYAFDLLYLSSVTPRHIGALTKAHYVYVVTIGGIGGSLLGTLFKSKFELIQKTPMLTDLLQIKTGAVEHHIFLFISNILSVFFVVAIFLSLNVFSSWVESASGCHMLLIPRRFVSL